MEYASRGIRVNAVSPGIIQTPMYPAESLRGLGSRLPPLGPHLALILTAALTARSAASPYRSGLLGTVS